MGWRAGRPDGTAPAALEPRASAQQSLLAEAPDAIEVGDERIDRVAWFDPELLGRSPDRHFVAIQDGRLTVDTPRREDLVKQREVPIARASRRGT